MNILLFNDNPVVRKLVALSAQKTKDELSVVWSTDEIDESGYDLLIIDDALYSDDVFAALKEDVAFKSTLLMATRGNAVPAGFDNVINKPFLPTDLVELFIQIQKKIESGPSAAAVSAPTVPEFDDEDAFALLPAEEPAEADEDDSLAINLEEELPELGRITSDFGEEAFDEGLDLGDLESFEEEDALMGILDKEEVQEVRELLEDTESDLGEEEIAVRGIEEFDLPEALSDTEEAFDVDLPMEEESAGFVEEADEGDELETLNFDEMLEALKEDLTDEEILEEGDREDAAAQIGAFEEEAPAVSAEEELLDDSDEALLEMMGLEEEAEEIGGIDGELFEDDEDLENLERRIQEAVDDLEPDELDMAFEEEMFNALETGAAEEMDLDFDELDMLDERELKMAIGEEVDDEDEPDIRVGEGLYSSLDAEALGEAMGKTAEMTKSPEKEEPLDVSGGAGEGVEALQALLKALSNEEVAKSLKGLNISININFGNDK